MHRLFIVILFIVFVTQVISADIPQGEDVLLENVEKMESGGSLYSDIETYLAPGQFYLVKAINNTFLIDSYNLLLSVLFVFMLTFIFRSAYFNNKGPNDKHYIFVNLAVVFVSAIVIYNFISISSSLLSSYMIVLLNTIIIFKYYESKKLYLLILGGALLGLAGVFRHDVVSYLYGAEFWGIFFFGIKFYSEADANIFKKFLIGMKYGLIFTIGILLVLLPVYLILHFTITGESLYYQLIEFPLFEFKDIYGIPLPNPFSSTGIINVLHSIWFYIPLVIFAITAFKLYFHSKSKVLTSDNLKFWKIIFLFNLGINSYNQALIVSDTYHLLPALLVAALLLFFVVDRIRFKILSVYLYIFMFLILGIL